MEDKDKPRNPETVVITGNVNGKQISLSDWLKSLPKGCKNFRIVENPKPKKPNLVLVKSDKDNQE